MDFPLPSAKIWCPKSTSNQSNTLFKKAHSRKKLFVDGLLLIKYRQITRLYNGYMYVAMVTKFSFISI